MLLADQIELCGSCADREGTALFERAISAGASVLTRCRPPSPPSMPELRTADTMMAQSSGCMTSSARRPLRIELNLAARRDGDVPAGLRLSTQFWCVALWTRSPRAIALAAFAAPRPEKISAAYQVRGAREQEP